MSMTGNISEVSSESTLRRLMRRLRPIMATGCRKMSSVIGPLLGRLVPGQRQEDVIERRAVQLERPHEVAAGVHLVEHRPDVRGAPVGRDLDGAPLAIGVLGQYAEKMND